MAESEIKKGARIELEAIRGEARGKATSLRFWMKTWRGFACVSDLAMILLAGLASASAAVALGDVFTAVTAGVAAAAAAFDTTVRPGQLAARANVQRSEWAKVESDADDTLGRLSTLTDRQATDELSTLKCQRAELERQVSKRKEYAPLAW